MVNAVYIEEFLQDFMRRYKLSDLVVGGDVTSEEEPYVKAVIEAQLRAFLIKDVTQSVLTETVLDVEDRLEGKWQDILSEYLKEGPEGVSEEVQASYRFLFSLPEEKVQALSDREFNMSLYLIRPRLNVLTLEGLETWWNACGFPVDQLQKHNGNDRVAFDGRCRLQLQEYTANKLTINPSVIRLVVKEYINHIKSKGRGWVEKLLKSEGEYKATEMVAMPPFSQAPTEIRSEDDDPDEPGVTILNVTYQSHPYWMHKSAFFYLNALANAIKVGEEINWHAVATHLSFYYKQKNTEQPKDIMFSKLLTRCMLRMFDFTVPYDWRNNPIGYIQSTYGQDALREGATKLNTSEGSIHMAMLHALSIVTSSLDNAVCMDALVGLGYDGNIVSSVTELAYLLDRRELLFSLIKNKFPVSDVIIDDVFKIILDERDMTAHLTDLLTVRSDLFSRVLYIDISTSRGLCDHLVRLDNISIFRIYEILNFVSDLSVNPETRPEFLFSGDSVVIFVTRALENLIDNNNPEVPVSADEVLSICRNLDLFSPDKLSEVDQRTLLHFFVEHADDFPQFLDLCNSSGLLGVANAIPEFYWAGNTYNSLLEFAIEQGHYGAARKLMGYGLYTNYDGELAPFLRLCIIEDDGNLSVNVDALRSLDDRNYNILQPCIRFGGSSEEFTLVEYALHPEASEVQPSSLLKVMVEQVLGPDKLGSVFERAGGNYVPPMYFAFRHNNYDAVKYLAEQGVVPVNPVLFLEAGVLAEDNLLYGLHCMADAVTKQMQARKGRLNMLDKSELTKVRTAIFIELFDHYAGKTIDVLCQDFELSQDSRFSSGDIYSAGAVKAMADSLLGVEGSDLTPIGCCGLRKQIKPVVAKVSTCVENQLVSLDSASQHHTAATMQSDITSAAHVRRR